MRGDIRMSEVYAAQLAAGGTDQAELITQRIGAKEDKRCFGRTGGRVDGAVAAASTAVHAKSAKIATARYDRRTLSWRRCMSGRPASEYTGDGAMST